MSERRKPGDPTPPTNEHEFNEWLKQRINWYVAEAVSSAVNKYYTSVYAEQYPREMWEDPTAFLRLPEAYFQQQENGNELVEQGRFLDQELHHLAWELRPALRGQLSHMPSYIVTVFDGGEKTIDTLRAELVNDIGLERFMYIKMALLARHLVLESSEYLNPGQTEGGGDVQDLAPQQRRRKFENKLPWIRSLVEDIIENSFSHIDVTSLVVAIQHGDSAVLEKIFAGRPYEQGDFYNRVNERYSEK